MVGLIMDLQIRDLLYKGKAKDVYQTDNPELVIIKFRDDITAGDGEKKDNLTRKGYYNSVISAKFFELLEDGGVKTQYIKILEPGLMLSHKLDMLPLEIITRNIAAGSLVRKFPFKAGQEFEPPIIQMDYKNDEYHDPMLNDDITLALDLSTNDELERIREITLRINDVLKGFLKDKNIILPDFKIEYGKDYRGEIVLGDEISPDTCRFWDAQTFDVLDKDLFRKGESNVIDAYQQVASHILNDEDKNKWKLNF
jgi:phosphoribosylaminoimidazole-succinocarboxamide synthase